MARSPFKLSLVDFDLNREIITPNNIVPREGTQLMEGIPEQV